MQATETVEPFSHEIVTQLWLAKVVQIEWLAFMHLLRFLRYSIFAIVVVAGLTWEVVAQTPATPQPSPSAIPQPTPQPYSVEPTVTPEMGDMGGKFFGKVPDPAKTKHYYIAAEPELWNFAPEGIDPICGKVFPASLQLNRSAWKVRYVQYADANFSARVLSPDRLGILGPILRGTTGQFLAVTFLNRSWQPLSMHPHGVRYDKDSEGSFYKPAPGLGAAVAPGAKFTYVWHLDEGSAPLPTEASSKAWLYHSHVSGDEEINMGLIGAIIVTDPARARPDGTPDDVDREMAGLFLIFDESGVVDSEDEVPEDLTPDANATAAAPVVPSYSETQRLVEEGQRLTINGRTFGNLTGLDMNEGERVRWYLFGLGSESDLHSAHWHGMTVVENAQRRTDVVELLPASMKVADMKADNPGQWLFHCHVAEHMSEGMFARFTVHPTSEPGVSRDPEVAFFGMPQSLATLKIENAELTLDKKNAAESEINLTCQVTVPDPYPLAKHEFSVKIGKKTLTLHPDASGLCVDKEATLLVKNATSIGVVTGGTMIFELTLKGTDWVNELKQLNLLQKKETLASDASLHVELQLADAHHTAVATLKNAPR